MIFIFCNSIKCLGFVKKIFPLVRSKKIASLSSPQRQIRKNVEQNRRDRDSGSDEGDQNDVKNLEKRKSKFPNNKDLFKEPVSINDLEEVNFSLTLKKTSLDLPEVTEALETLRRHGGLVEEKRRKRVSNESCGSGGGSSGYLGGSSSGITTSSASSRSRYDVIISSRAA